MLNINVQESLNKTTIEGILKELDIEERTAKTGKNYVTGKATVKVDQEINGKVVECEIPVRLFAMELTTSGEQSKLYTRILSYRDTFTSLAACPEGNANLASKVSITNAKITENNWLTNSGEVKSSFQVESNFMEIARPGFKEQATFELSGVVLNKTMEVDATTNEETGRMKIKFGVVGYKGKLNVIELIAATPNAVDFIDQNWNEGDTVTTYGAVSINQSTKTWKEEQGFGEPILRTKTISRKELIILSGSESGLEEEFSYEPNDIKKALETRNANLNELKERSKPKNQGTGTGTRDFGF